MAIPSAKNKTRQKREPVDNRKRYYAMLAIGKDQLGFDDIYYYNIWLPMQGATKNAEGRYSATTMDIGQLSAAVERMRIGGAKFTARKSDSKQAEKKDWRAPRIAKLDIMWIKLHEHGHIEDRSRAALEKWCKKYIKKDSLRWSTSAELNQCIEQLKAYLQRCGVGV